MKRKASGGGSSKRQRQADMVQPGEYGVYVTCPRGKEAQAAKEMKVILGDAIEKYYPAGETEENEEQEVVPAENADVEDDIAAEVAALKAAAKSKAQRYRQIHINAESLLFFKLRAPVVPSVLVRQLCEELLASGDKRGRYIQRLVGVDASCSPTEEGWKKMLGTKVDEYLGQRRGGKYCVNLVRRHFETFERDTIEAHVAAAMAPHDFSHRYKDVDVVVNIYCFKNNMGISLMEYDDWVRLAKCNLQMVYDLANGEHTALGRQPLEAAPKPPPQTAAATVTDTAT